MPAATLEDIDQAEPTAVQIAALPALAAARPAQPLDAHHAPRTCTRSSSPPTAPRAFHQVELAELAAGPQSAPLVDRTIHRRHRADHPSRRTLRVAACAAAV